MRGLGGTMATQHLLEEQGQVGCPGPNKFSGDVHGRGPPAQQRRAAGPAGS